MSSQHYGYCHLQSVHALRQGPTLTIISCAWLCSAIRHMERTRHAAFIRQALPRRDARHVLQKTTFDVSVRQGIAQHTEVWRGHLCW